MDLGWINGAVAGLAVGLLTIGATTHETRVMVPDDGRLAALERQVASGPYEVGPLLELTGAYLDAAQPGMALALLARSSSETRRDPEVTHALARALFEDGRTREALATELKALDACNEGVCRNKLLAQATRRVEFFQAVLDLGVENPLLSPETVRIAYARSSREVRLEVQ
jgi:Flp pilus assembly protein TadD